jgi:hypothetical protein
LFDEGIQTQLPFQFLPPVRCGEVMVLLQFPEETLIGHAVFLPELLANLAVKGGDEIARQIPVYARFVVQPVGDLKSYLLHNLRSAGCIV